MPLRHFTKSLRVTPSTVSLDHQATIMKNKTPAWIRVDVQIRIEPPKFTLFKKEPNDINYYDISKIKMCRNLSNANSGTYKPKIVTFEHIQPE